jgi:hypothetical protein
MPASRGAVENQMSAMDDHVPLGQNGTPMDFGEPIDDTPFAARPSQPPLDQPLPNHSEILYPAAVDQTRDGLHQPSGVYKKSNRMMKRLKNQN